MKLTAHIKITGGNMLSAANASRIVARSTRQTDEYGNALVKGRSPIDRLRDDPPYTQVWRLRKEPEGYIFREVRNNQGICGHRKTVRAQVAAVLVGGYGIDVEVEQ